MGGRRCLVPAELVSRCGVEESGERSVCVGSSVSAGRCVQDPSKQPATLEPTKPIHSSDCTSGKVNRPWLERALVVNSVIMSKVFQNRLMVFQKKKKKKKKKKKS